MKINKKRFPDFAHQQALSFQAASNAQMFPMRHNRARSSPAEIAAVYRILAIALCHYNYRIQF